MNERRGERPSRWVRFGELIRLERERVGRDRGHKLTQEECAEAATISVKQWSRIESGSSGTDFQTLPRLLGALGISETDSRRGDFYRAAGFLPPDDTGDDNAMRRLGRKLARAREDAGLTQQDMADILSMSRGGYSHYEDGTSPLAAVHLAQIARATKRPVAWFYDETATGTVNHTEYAHAAPFNLEELLERMEQTVRRIVREEKDQYSETPERKLIKGNHE